MNPHSLFIIDFCRRLGLLPPKEPGVIDVETIEAMKARMLNEGGVAPEYGVMISPEAHKQLMGALREPNEK